MPRKSETETVNEAEKPDVVLRTELPPGVEPGESLDPKENPRVGEQDLPVEERTDGRTDGIRHDQMEGVQVAYQDNPLNPDEEIERNLENPPNSAVRTARRDAANTRTRRQAVEDDRISPRTRAEMDRGRELAGRYAPASDTTKRRRATKAGE